MKQYFYMKHLNRVVCFFLFMISFGLSAQTTTVKGKVSDIYGPALPGVNIVQKGTTNGVVTDFDGNYEITLKGDSNVLVFSFIGYQSKEVNVENQSIVNVVLDEDAQSLDEVVVIGYGTAKKVNLTGAVDVATSERLENRAITNVGEGLQGVIPNLNISVLSGDPTEAPQFNIRGFESINGGAPLILVDGVPMDLNRINPEDIASVTVLKDGASSAIYGARAAFGVILVQTKKGKLGKVNVQVSSLFSWNKPIYNINQIENGYIYALERNKVATRDGGTPVYDDAYIESLKNYWEDPANNPEYEIVDGTFRNYGNPGLTDDLVNEFSPRQKIDFAISGASDNVNYYTSFGYFNTDGVYNHPKNDNYKRYNVLAKADYKINDWITFESQITGNFENSDKPSQVDLNSLIRVEPIRPYIVPLLPGYEQYEGMSWGHAFPEYARLQDGGRTKFTNQDVWMNAGLVLTPVKNLVVKSNFSYNFFNRQFESAKTAFETVSQDLEQDNPIVIQGDNTIDVSRDYNQYYVFNAFAEYTLDQIENHYFKFMAGYNQEYGLNTNVRGDANQLVSPNIIDISATTGTRFITGGKSELAIRGVFYRFNYSYKDKYLFETSARYDGTSRFPEADRFGFFPSFSLGWRISEESFMAGTEGWLDNLKLRYSYGELGNQTFGNNYYPYIPSLNVSTSNFVLSSGQIPMVSPPGLVSPSLTWEKVVSSNFGLDIIMLKNRLDMSFDIYTRDTRDMLLRRIYPETLGANPPQENGADLRTKGWEVSIKWRDNIGDDLNYYVNFNLADWTSEITKYENPTGAISEYYEGQKIGEIWGYDTVGIIQDEDQLAGIANQDRLGNGWKVGDIEFADTNGDGVISNGSNTLDDPGDTRIIGNTTPRYSYGINGGLQYKGISFDIFFQGVAKRDYYPSNGNWTWFFPWRSYNGDESWLKNTWTPENRDAYFPEAQLDDKNNVEQTRFLQDASYIRLKNINLGYTIPAQYTEQVGISSLKVFIAGQNLWESSDIRKPLDPEYVFDASIAYPLLRTYSIGMTLNF